jgi:hypothetical protein
MTGPAAIVFVAFDRGEGVIYFQGSIQLSDEPIPPPFGGCELEPPWVKKVRYTICNGEVYAAILAVDYMWISVVLSLAN